MTMMTKEGKSLDLGALETVRDGVRLEKVSIGGEFTDDRLPCFDVQLQIDGETLELSVWWVEPRAWYHAEVGVGLVQLLSVLQEEAKDEIAEVTG